MNPLQSTTNVCFLRTKYVLETIEQHCSMLHVVIQRSQSIFDGTDKMLEKFSASYQLGVGSSINMNPTSQHNNFWKYSSFSRLSFFEGCHPSYGHHPSRCHLFSKGYHRYLALCLTFLVSQSMHFCFSKLILGYFQIMQGAEILPGSHIYTVSIHPTTRKA